MRWSIPVLAGCALTLAACGGSGASGYHNPHYPYGAPNVPNSISRCMRANGVSGFPDPREGPNGGGVGFPGGLMVTSDGGMVVEGIPFSGPALLQAEKVCKEYLPSGAPPPGITEQQHQRAIENAACMRRHGINNFPDPTFGPGGSINLNLGPGLNPRSPAFQHAAAACGLQNQQSG